MVRLVVFLIMVLITSCGNTPVEKPNPFIDPVVTLQCVGDGSLSFNFHTNKEYKRNDLLYGGKVITLTAPSMKVKTHIQTPVSYTHLTLPTKA